MVPFLEITIPNHVFKALVAGTCPQETHIVNGCPVAVGGSSSCEGDLVPTMSASEFQQHRIDLVVSRGDGLDGFAVPNDLELAGCDWFPLTSSIVEPESKDVAESPLMLGDDGVSDCEANEQQNNESCFHE